MPTYTVKYSNFELSKEKKKKIAKGITKIHSEVTGANTYFAQVIFQQIKKNSHFMGGKLAKGKEIFLNGQIRNGRSPLIKKKLILRLKDILTNIINIRKDKIWIYLQDLPPEQMIEYGEILPQSGKEKKWFESLPTVLKKRLKKIENTK